MLYRSYNNSHSERQIDLRFIWKVKSDTLDLMRSSSLENNSLSRKAKVSFPMLVLGAKSMETGLLKRLTSVRSLNGIRSFTY